MFTVRSARADGGPAFDLDGPRIQAKVTRAGKTLPIGTVANLAVGDRLWIHPDFPENNGARYVLVVAFLRGSVNPPPDNWFTKAESWNKKIREEGLYVTVPDGETVPVPAATVAVIATGLPAIPGFGAAVTACAWYRA